MGKWEGRNIEGQGASGLGETAGERYTIQVKDMLLKQAIEEKREMDAKAVEAFGGHLENPESI